MTATTLTSATWRTGKKLDRTVVKETLRFTMLAPDIVQAVLDGRQCMLTLHELRR